VLANHAPDRVGAERQGEEKAHIRLLQEHAAHGTAGQHRPAERGPAHRLLDQPQVERGEHDHAELAEVARVGEEERAADPQRGQRAQQLRPHGKAAGPQPAQDGQAAHDQVEGMNPVGEEAQRQEGQQDIRPREVGEHRLAEGDAVIPSAEERPRERSLAHGQRADVVVGGEEHMARRQQHAEHDQGEDQHGQRRPREGPSGRRGRRGARSVGATGVDAVLALAINLCV
jgi:hypothetical protein